MTPPGTAPPSNDPVEESPASLGRRIVPRAPRWVWGIVLFVGLAALAAGVIGSERARWAGAASLAGIALLAVVQIGLNRRRRRGPRRRKGKAGG